MHDAKQIQIGHRLVGNGAPTYIIAEIGSNHNQDMALAKELIDAAAEAGADAAKFQSLKFDELYLPDKTTPEFREFFAQIELSETWYAEISAHCQRRGLHFISSPTYVEAIELLRQHGVPAYKIASAQFGVYDELVARAAATGLPLVMSTGIADYGDIQRTLELCRRAGNDQLVLLHCVSQYPTEPQRANLRLIQTYRQAFGCLVGYSDHTHDIHFAPAAVALGAVVLEKHLTLDRSLPGPDHHFAIEPAEFREMVRHVREIEAGMGDGLRPALTPDELAFRADVSFKWVARGDLPKGERILRDHLTLRRTAGGIPAEMLEHLVCHRLRRDMSAGTLLSWEDLEYVG